MRKIVRLFPVLSFALCFSALSATSVSPNISGTWTGSAAGRGYKVEVDQNGNQTNMVETVSATLSVNAVQSGTDLTLDVQVTTANDGTNLVTFTGKAGDFALWATAVQTNQDSTEQIFLSGIYASRGDKITGTIVIYKDQHAAQLSFKLTKSVAKLSRAAGAARAAQSIPTATSRQDGPFNVAGKVSGSSYTLATNAKAAKYSGTMTGAFADTSATLTVTAADGTLTYDVTQTGTDGAIVLFGSGGLGGSESFVAFLKTSNNAGVGTAWVFSQTRLVQVKLTAKKQ
ncbi:MAG TPA: hypothetical protein VGP72_28290 [Planctomycetota bacterium]|jgi:hypothetical protein